MFIQASPCLTGTPGKSTFSFQKNSSTPLPDPTKTDRIHTENVKNTS